MRALCTAALLLLLACGDDDESRPTPTTEAPPETEPTPDPAPEEPSGDPLPEPRPRFALGGVHSCDLDAEGAVRCWGSQQFGQLGDPGISPGDYEAHRGLPAAVPGIEGVVALFAGNFHNCTLHADHAVRCWGHDGFGQSSGRGGEDIATPTVVVGLERPVELALGRQHTCARLADRRVFCFGDNGWGQLGDGSLEARRGPVRVEGIDDAVAVSAGRDHTCALREGNVVTCWGAAVDGQLGGRVRAPASGTPVEIDQVPEGVTAISAGGLHTCVLAAGGRVHCWGANDAHQMGNARGGEQDDHAPHPVRVLDIEGVAEIAAGGRHSCARKPDGTVFCWGANHFGQLGDGTELGANRPTQVRGLDDATTLAAGTRHTCAHRRRGDQVCWGANRLGQLGDGGDEKVPVGVVVGSGELIAEPDDASLRPRDRGGAGMGMAVGMEPPPAPPTPPSPPPSPTPAPSPPPTPAPSPPP